MKLILPDKLVNTIIATTLVFLSSNLPSNAGSKNNAAPKAAESADGDEALVLNLAPNWKLANQRQVKNENVVQYLPTGANPENPVEMITVTTITGVGPDQTAKKYIYQVRNAIESGKEGASIKWHLLSESTTDATCEYVMSGHLKIPNQHEIMRVLRGGQELHSIIYHFGKLTISQAEHDRALNFVNSVKVVPASSSQ